MTDVEVSKQKDSIGIIYPPPDVRNIVDKTAVYIAKYGADFEAKIQQTEANNIKFNFLKVTDPYHSYYRHRVREITEGNVVDEPTVVLKPAVSEVSQKPAQAFKLPETIVLKDPPSEPEFIIDPPSISSYELDILKLTAQFVARNGRQFLNNLMNKESRNYEFDFLRPQHSLFNFFTKMVDQYNKVLLPSRKMLENLEKQVEDPKHFYNDVLYRAEWAKQQERQKKREGDEREKERVAYAKIDWHRFLVVGYSDPFDSENLPPMVKREDVGARVVEQERHQLGSFTEVEEPEPVTSKSVRFVDMPNVTVEDDSTRGADTNIQDMEENSDSEEENGQENVVFQVPQLPKEAPQQLNAENIIIRTDYDPKAKRQREEVVESDGFLISPLTNEKIPANKITEHLRIGLLDPKWIEQRDRVARERKEQDEVLAQEASFIHLKNLAERRSDIFGSHAEETQIGRKVGEEEKKEKVKVTWDGHSSSSEKVIQKIRENVSIEQQIADIHKSRGMLPDAEKERIGPAIPINIQPPAPTQPVITQVQSSNIPPAPFVRPPVGPPHPMVRPMTTSVAPSGPLGFPPQAVRMAQPFCQPGIIPQMPPFMPPMGFIPGPAPQGPLMPPVHFQHHIPARDESEEPLSKKAKLEGSLIPEYEFIAMNPSDVEFKVDTSMIEKSEWKLNGQMLSIALPLSDTVSVIKAKIFDEVGMPAGKQKLQLDGMFLKDSNTLAYYNFNPSTIVLLQLKERGGRKK